MNPQGAPQHVDFALAPLLQLLAGAHFCSCSLELLLQEQRVLLLCPQLAPKLSRRAGLREPRLELPDHLALFHKGALHLSGLVSTSRHVDSDGDTNTVLHFQKRHRWTKITRGAPLRCRDLLRGDRGLCWPPPAGDHARQGPGGQS